MPYAEYQSLLRLPPAAARKALMTARPARPTAPSIACSASVDDDGVDARCSADLGGHDLALILDALDEAARHRDGPSVIVAHTIKGWGLPMAGDPMNHTALLTTRPDRGAARVAWHRPGDEWAGFAEGARRRR